jgi:hypothetical protein
MDHPQNKVPEVGVFFRVEKLAANNHLHHAKHHKLTTKTPHIAPRFCEKPLQNHRFSSPIKKDEKGGQQRSLSPLLNLLKRTDKESKAARAAAGGALQKVGSY